jgi:hypothetical protein
MPNRIEQNNFTAENERFSPFYFAFGFEFYYTLARVMIFG